MGMNNTSFQIGKAYSYTPNSFAANIHGNEKLTVVKVNSQKVYVTSDKEKNQHDEGDGIKYSRRFTRNEFRTKCILAK